MIHKLFKRIIYSVAFIGFVAILFLPSLHQKIGNVFFGQSPFLYNANVAQFFFKQATKPLWGVPPEFSHYQLSRTYFIQGEFTEAIVEAEKELQLYPDNYRTHYILGLTYGYMNREVEAIDEFEKFIKEKPESWAARNDRAWLQFRVGDIDGALETIIPATHLTGNPWVQNTYGVLLLNKNRYKEAREALMYAQNAALLMNEEMWGMAYPGNSPTIYGLGLEAMRESIITNLNIVNQEISINQKHDYD